MLTTDQILNAIFTPVSAGAYSAEEVDLFLNKVAESYEEALQTNKELIKKISILADKIESYRSDEEAIKLALLDARRLAESINKEATAKAESVVKAADAEAAKVIDAATAEAARITDEAKTSAKGIVDNARVAVQSLTDRAQRETEQAITAAQQKATEIILRAEAQGREIIGTSKADYERYSSELVRVKKESAAFKSTIAALLAGQTELISSLPDEAFAVEESEETPAVADVPVAVEDPAEETAAEPDAPDTVEEIIEEVAEADFIVEPVEEIPAPAASSLFDEIIEEVEGKGKEIPEVEAEPVIEESVVETPVAEAPAVEETAAEAPAVDEPEEVEFLDIPEVEDVPVVEEEEDVDDLFSMIEELSFDDIVAPDEIPATLDAIAVEAPAEEAPVEAELAEDAEDDEEDFGSDDDFDFDDDDDFDGFKIDLDEITSDSDDSEGDDITSLFDSFFGE